MRSYIVFNNTIEHHLNKLLKLQHDSELILFMNLIFNNSLYRRTYCFYLSNITNSIFKSFQIKGISKSYYFSTKNAPKLMISCYLKVCRKCYAFTNCFYNDIEVCTSITKIFLFS